MQSSLIRCLIVETLFYYATAVTRTKVRVFVFTYRVERKGKTEKNDFC